MFEKFKVRIFKIIFSRKVVNIYEIYEMSHQELKLFLVKRDIINGARRMYYKPVALIFLATEWTDDTDTCWHLESHQNSNKNPQISSGINKKLIYNFFSFWKPISNLLNLGWNTQINYLNIQLAFQLPCTKNMFCIMFFIVLFSLLLGELYQISATSFVPQIFSEFLVFVCSRDVRMHCRFDERDDTKIFLEEFRKDKDDNQSGRNIA